MENKTGLNEIIAEVQFNLEKGEPCVCQKCGEQSTSILKITANIVYHHPDLKGKEDDRILSVWTISGCEWCINQIIKWGTKPPPNVKFVIPTAM